MFTKSIRLFGAFRDLSPEGTFPLNVEGSETVAQLKLMLGRELGKVKTGFDVEALMAKSVLATDDRVLTEGEKLPTDELSILPPVCGG